MSSGFMDIIDEIKSRETLEDSKFDSIQTFTMLGINWALFFGLGYWGNPATRDLGLLILVFSLFGMIAAWYGPAIKASYVVRSRVYLKVRGWFGKFYFPFQMELIDYPKVVAKEYEDGEIVSLDYSEYVRMFDALKMTNLEEIDIDKEIQTAFRARVDKKAVDEANKERGYKRLWKQIKKLKKEK